MSRIFWIRTTSGILTSFLLTGCLIENPDYVEDAGNWTDDSPKDTATDTEDTGLGTETGPDGDTDADSDTDSDIRN